MISRLPAIKSAGSPIALRRGKVRRMKRSRRWIGILIRAIIGFTIVLMLFRWYEHRQTYHPSRNVDVAVREFAGPSEDVFFRTRDNVQLNGWFFPAPTNSTRRHLAVLLCHGNGGNISHRVDVCSVLRGMGLNVFVFDYRGYGLSEGRPSEQGTYLDAQAAYQWLRNKGFEVKHIIAHGESLGGGVATELCLRETLGGLVLQSTFTSLPDIGAELFPWLPVRLLGSIRYDTIRKLPQLSIPVLVMHSRDDGLIRFQHSERNFTAAREPKLFCELQGGHNDPLADQEAFVAGIEKFLQLVDPAKSDSAL